VDHKVIEEPAMVEPLIDDDRIVAGLRVVVSVELDPSPDNGVWDMDVCCAAMGFLFDLSPIVFAPGTVS
jgi:hypothetical protein